MLSISTSNGILNQNCCPSLITSIILFLCVIYNLHHNNFHFYFILPESVWFKMRRMQFFATHFRYRVKCPVNAVNK